MFQNLLSRVSELKFKDVMDGLLLFLAFFSANFVSYIYYYDLNILSLIDSSSIVSHISTMSLYYVISYALVSVLLNVMIASSEMDFSNVEEHYTGNKIGRFIVGCILSFSEIFRSLLPVFSNRIFKIISIVSLFSFLYVGFLNFIYIVIVFVFYLCFLIFMVIFNKFINQDSVSKVIKKDGKEKEIYILLTKKMTADIFMNDSINVVMSKFGVLLILISVSLGTARADYVTKSSFIFINSTQSYSIVINTSSGVVVRSHGDQSLSFFSWDDFSKSKFDKTKEESSFNLFLTTTKE